jgi:hypothetical protein
MAFLELKGVEKSFGPVKTIHGIDLAIEKGEFGLRQEHLAAADRRAGDDRRRYVGARRA